MYCIVIVVTGTSRFVTYQTLHVMVILAPETVAVLRLGHGGTDPQILPRPPKFLDTVVLLLVELIGSIVNFA